jgi:hypothetical protein
MLFIIFLLTLPAILVRAWVLTVLWAWFIVPTFPSMPVLTMLPALGIALTANLFLDSHGHMISSIHSKVTEGEDMVGKSIGSMLYHYLSPLFALLFGWIFTLFG